MPVHVALLRGINVGGKNVVPMKALVEVFAGTGCADVATYVQSGNVVFHATAAVARRVPDAVAAAILARFGHRVPVVLRSAAELLAVARAHPLGKPGADPKTLHVAFLAAAPSAAAVAALDPARSPPDTFLVRGRDVFLCLPSGAGKTRLTNDYLDRTLATISTMRNWNTVQALAGMVADAAGG